MFAKLPLLDPEYPGWASAETKYIIVQKEVQCQVVNEQNEQR